MGRNFGEVGNLDVNFKRKMLNTTQPGKSKKVISWALRWAVHLKAGPVELCVPVQPLAVLAVPSTPGHYRPSAFC